MKKVDRTMKSIKIIIMTLVISFLFGVGYDNIVSVFAEDNIKVVFNDEEITFDVSPIIINNRTMVPMRAIYEALGATVEWNIVTNTASGTKNGIVVEFTIGEPKVYVNMNAKVIDAPAVIINDRTLVPVRALAEGFGIDVKWDSTKHTVFLKDVGSYVNNESLYIDDRAITYSGQISNGLPNGYGTIKYKDGTFIGYFENGLLCKSGMATWDDGDHYVGEWENGEFNGYGIYCWADGGRYQGDWVNGKINGYGERYFTYGERYFGNWENNMYNGYGEYYFADGSYYKGNWANDKCSGYGEWYYPDGAYYKGYWANGLFNGWGEYHFANGEYYKGNNVDEKRNGYGEWYWPNGSYYKGNWENNMFNGYGTMYDSKTGKKIVGMWKDDVFIG